MWLLSLTQLQGPAQASQSMLVMTPPSKEKPGVPLQKSTGTEQAEVAEAMLAHHHIMVSRQGSDSHPRSELPLSHAGDAAEAATAGGKPERQQRQAPARSGQAVSGTGSPGNREHSP